MRAWRPISSGPGPRCAQGRPTPTHPRRSTARSSRQPRSSVSRCSITRTTPSGRSGSPRYPRTSSPASAGTPRSRISTPPGLGRTSPSSATRSSSACSCKGRVRSGFVLADGRRVEAETVVLTAGAYFTPTILLRSGIGPEAELRRHGIPLAVALPVGERLLDHCGSGIAWEPTEELHSRTAAHVRDHGRLFEPHAVLKAASSSCPAGTLGHPPPVLDESGERDDRPLRGELRVLPHEAALCRASPPSLRRPDRLAGRRARVPQPEGGHARHRRGAGAGARRRRHRAVSRAAGATRWQPAERNLEEYVAATVRNYFHPAGTCAIGEVTDVRGRVLGTDGLIVADASLMPTIPRSNTNLTTVAIAERIADTSL